MDRARSRTFLSPRGLQKRSLRGEVSVVSLLLIAALCPPACEQRRSPARAGAQRLSAAEEDSPGSASAAAFAEEHQVAGDPVAFWLPLWERAARAEHMPPQQTEDVSGVIRDALGCVPGPLPEHLLTAEGGEAAFASLRRFVKSNRWLFDSGHQSGRTGVGYWLAFCVAEATAREPMGDEGASAVERSYDQALADLCDALEHQYLAEIPPDRPSPRLTRAIQVEMGTLREELSAKVRACRADPLCPAFRKPVARATVDKVRSSLQALRYEDPPVLMMRRDEWFMNRLPSHCRSEGDSILYHLFLSGVQPQLYFNRYWGYMKWSGGSSETEGGAWPAFFTFRPSKSLNEINQWRREE